MPRKFWNTRLFIVAHSEQSIISSRDFVTVTKLDIIFTITCYRVRTQNTNCSPAVEKAYVDWDKGVVAWIVTYNRFWIKKKVPVNPEVVILPSNLVKKKNKKRKIRTRERRITKGREGCYKEIYTVSGRC